LLAGACDSQQADALAQKLADPGCFGGEVPWPSVARDDPEFRPKGMYWRGGVWVPVAYVSARALADHGHGDLAHSASLTLIRHMARTYAEYAPATIWEAYSPRWARPSTAKDDEEISRPDFCGWSALAPISMLIEHVLGFRVDALRKTVTWQRRLPGRHGIRDLRCGDVTLSAIADGDVLRFETTGEVTVVVDGTAHPLRRGHHTLGTTA
jgi:glycogen debranching enzyme